MVLGITYLLTYNRPTRQHQSQIHESFALILN